MASGWSSSGLIISSGAHALAIGAMIFGPELFTPPDREPMRVVETSIISEAELMNLAARAEAPPPPPPAAEAPPPPPPAAPAPPPPPPEAEAPPPPPPAAEAPPPPPPEPEPAAPEPAAPEPEAELADGPPPYQSAPEAPSELALDPRAVSDQAADREIREALPPVRVSAESPEPLETDVSEADPTVERDADDAAEEPARDEEPNRPRIAAAPAQPQAVNRDQPPARDFPDVPEQEVAEAEPERRPDVAPKSAPVPRLRPTRQAAAAPPQTQPDAADSFLDDLDSTFNQLASNEPQPTTRAQTQRGANGRVTSKPLSAREKSLFELNFKRYWSPPSPGPDLADLVVTLEITVGPDGELLSQPSQISPRGDLTPRQATAIFNAMRAVREGAPYRGPLEKYDQWRKIRVTYDPKLQEATFN
ncbi:MAG: hypothetical protein AAGM38_13065 [Pseudomonadota bacterium]